MNYQEALDIINERFDYMNEELHPKKHYQKPQFSLDTLQELIDKATPKKVIHMAIDDKEADYYYCPNCKADVYMDNSYNYCKNCGQALDWSEENGK